MRTAAWSAGVALVREIGESDCEELGTGFVVQPVNALSSLAYVVVGLATIVWARRAARLTSQVWVFGALLIAIGLGSVAFHGPQPTGARAMHDVPILLLVVFMVSHDLRTLRPAGPTEWAYFATGCLLAVVATVVDIEAVAILTGGFALVLVVLELLVHRRHLRPLDDRPRRIAAALLLGTLIVAAATWLLGRTDSPACDPDSVLQLHGVWHLLSAVVFGLWAYLALGRTEPVHSQLSR